MNCPYSRFFCVFFFRMATVNIFLSVMEIMHTSLEEYFYTICLKQVNFCMAVCLNLLFEKDDIQMLVGISRCSIMMHLKCGEGF